MDRLDQLMHSTEIAHTMFPAIPRETTPTRITPAIERLCERLSPGKKPYHVRVEPAASADVNECYKNVEAMIERNDGRNRTGWLVWEMSGVLINAERHSCWESPNGEVVDVTPKPDGETHILFLPDSDGWNGDRVCPVVHPLRQELPVQDYVKAFLQERRQWAKRITDFGRKHRLSIAARELNEFLARRSKKRRKRRLYKE